MKVAIFIPCFVDQLYPQTAVSMVKVLRKAGCEVVYNANQTCCGQPAYNAGFSQMAQPVCKKFVTDMSLLAADYIVAPSGSCVGFVRSYYHKVLDGSPQQAAYEAVAAKLYEFTEFLVNVLQIDDFGAEFEAVCTYHDACGALRECGIKDAPRRLLQKVKGLTLIEHTDCEVCCGFGGTFSINMAPIAGAMAQQKVENAWLTDADFVVSTDVSCLMHLEGYAKKIDKPIHFTHIANILASGW